MRSQPPQAGAHEDPKTVAYFDEKVHDYSVERLQFVAEHMRALARPGTSIIDLGCGTGNTLAYLKSGTGIDDLWGVDVSARCLEAVAARVGCPTYRGSILDEDLPARIGRRFDF